MKRTNANAVEPTELVFTAESTGRLLGPGSHTVTIEEISLSTPKYENSVFKDKHDQIKTVFIDENTGMQHTEWFNTKGFARYEDLAEADKRSGKFEDVSGFAVNKSTGLRVIDPQRTKSAMSIFAKLGLDCGVPKGETFKPAELVGESVVIIIGEDTYGGKVQTKLQSTRPVASLAVDAQM